MIYTITFNPSIDYVMYTDSFDKNSVNRMESEEIYPGGKGINVSVVLKNLGFESKALGFTAGFSGCEIENILDKIGCDNQFIRIKDGFSRINVKVREENSETDFNGQGPLIQKSDIDKLFSILENVCDDDFIVLAGSIPKTLPEDIYEAILERLKDKRINSVVDATGDLLLNVLKYKPFLIKPNHIELGEIFNKSLSDVDEIVLYAKKLRNMGAVNVIVSMAERGAILVDENNEVHILSAPAGKLVNSVGAGDSMVAGFIAGFIETGDYERAFKKAVASGSASAFKKWLAEKNDVDKILEVIS